MTIAISATDEAEDFQDFDAINWLGFAVNLLTSGSAVCMLRLFNILPTNTDSKL
jgi:hypothetical protein